MKYMKEKKDQLGFIHQFLKPEHFNPDKSMTLLLLHGTGGGENDLLRPKVLAGSILFRAMVPFVLESIPKLSDKYIFMSAGLHDSVVPRTITEDLFDLLKKTGSKVSLTWQNSGHELTQKDVNEAREWYQHLLLK